MTRLIKTATSGAKALLTFWCLRHGRSRALKRDEYGDSGFARMTIWGGMTARGGMTTWGEMTTWRNPMVDAVRLRRTWGTRLVMRFTSILLEVFHVAQVERFELLADLEEEEAEDEDADQHVERDAELDDHRHAVGGAGGGEEEAVFHGEESDDLGDGFAARDHHQERQQDDGERDAQRVARDGGGHHADGLRQSEREDDQHQAGEHGDGNIDDGLRIPFRAQAMDQAVQDEWQADELQQQRERRGVVELLQAGAIRNQAGRSEERRVG